MAITGDDVVMSMRAGRMALVQRWILARPVLRIVVTVAMAAPLVVAGTVAVTGRVGAVVPGVLAILSALFGSWMMFRGGWDLDRGERVMVWDATWSGRSTGDARLDAIAGYQLEGACRSEGVDRVFVPVFLALTVLVPIAAVVRTADMWWLFALAASASIVIVTLPMVLAEPAGDRLRRLLDSAD